MTATLLAIAFQERRTALPGPDGEVQMSANPKVRCDAEGDELVVCGRNEPMRYRVERIAPRFEEKPIRPEFKLPGGVTSVVEAEQHTVGAGVSAPAAMIRFKLPIGPGKRKSDTAK